MQKKNKKINKKIGLGKKLTLALIDVLLPIHVYIVNLIREKYISVSSARIKLSSAKKSSICY